MSGSYYPPNTDIRFKMITPEQETALFVRAKGTPPDEEARTFLITNHLLFAAMTGRGMAKGKLPDEDVVSAANLALMKAFDRFDHTFGNRFTSYLRPFIKGEISVLWKRYFEDLRGSPNYREPSKPSVYVDGECLAPASSPEGSETPPQMIAEDSEHLAILLKQLDECRDTLKPHEREVIELHYFKGVSLTEIGRLRNPPVTRSAISATRVRALSKLAKSMKRRGYAGSV